MKERSVRVSTCELQLAFFPKPTSPGLQDREGNTQEEDPGGQGREADAGSQDRGAEGHVSFVPFPSCSLEVQVRNCGPKRSPPPLFEEAKGTGCNDDIPTRV
jgi:hypothetical protein